ncbi:uncharacterized protein LOC127276987 [Leptopilina boulardi]|uniref:uncharacterized protein LOC127276987 n=1 Tax=Leptopilina boulardi TaxID=63433 RepID=UPI0021F62390|nr:uncharacterized protein LOC127276987 [Leptopilina boulardi]
MENLGSTDPSKLIKTSAYVKSAFKVIKDKKGSKLFACGSLIDEVYQLEIHIIHFKEEDLNKLKKDIKLEMFGFINFSSPTHFIVKRFEDIIRIEGEIKQNDFFKKGFQRIKRKIFNDGRAEHTVKKMKFS